VKKKCIIIGILISIGIGIILTGGCLNISEWPTQINHKLNLTSTINPWHPEIIELNAELNDRLTINDHQSEEKRLNLELYHITWLIEEKIKPIPDIHNPYHPALEHYPTISQALEGYDDCDGRAIIACSLLIHRGYNSYMIINDNHAWVIIYLQSGESKEILRETSTPSPGEWILQWNHEYIKINLSNPILITPLLLISLGLLILCLKNILSNRTRTSQISN
jgi:hypothetical protein